MIDDATGAIAQTLPATGEPFAVGFLNDTIVASIYNSDHVDVWRPGTTNPVSIVTGPHPTQLLVDGGRFFVTNADGHDLVEVDGRTLAVLKRYDLATHAEAPPGQTPAGMAISADRTMLFVTESGFNDVAIVDLARGRLTARIPTAWYPMSVAFVSAATVDKKDARFKPQLWITSAKGLGSQPDPAGEWNGNTGLVQHLVVEPRRFAA